MSNNKKATLSEANGVVGSVESLYNALLFGGWLLP